MVTQRAKAGRVTVEQSYRAVGSEAGAGGDSATPTNR